MRSFILFMALLGGFYLLAEEKIITGKVCDNKNLPVSFASIGIIGTAYGTVSDENGSFIFYVPEGASKTDSLKVSCIGYSYQTYLLSAIEKTLRVILQPQAFNLPEVTVKSGSFKTKIIGSTDIRARMTCNFSIGAKPNQNLGSEIGRKFILKGKKHLVKKFNVYTAQNFDTILFRLNIYNIKNGHPHESLLKENILLKIMGRKKEWSTVNLEEYNLVFDENVIISLQWVGNSKIGNKLLLPITVPSFGAVHFYKMGSQAKWRRYNNMSTPMNLEVAVEE